MKTKLISSELKKDFIPFKVELEVKSIEEAILFYGIVNHTNLLSLIKGESWTWLDE